MIGTLKSGSDREHSDLFLTKLTDRELAVLESALAKVTLECTFG